MRARNRPKDREGHARRAEKSQARVSHPRRLKLLLLPERFPDPHQLVKVVLHDSTAQLNPRYSFTLAGDARYPCIRLRARPVSSASGVAGTCRARSSIAGPKSRAVRGTRPASPMQPMHRPLRRRAGRRKCSCRGANSLLAASKYQLGLALSCPPHWGPQCPLPVNRTLPAPGRVTATTSMAPGGPAQAGTADPAGRGVCC